MKKVIIIGGGIAGFCSNDAAAKIKRRAKTMNASEIQQQIFKKTRDKTRRNKA